MKLVLLCLLLGFSAFGYEFTKEDRAKIDKDGKRFAREIRDDIQNGRMSAMARRTDEAIKYMIQRGNEELRKRGDYDGAYFFEFKYQTEFSGYLTKMVVSDRNIGDHKPLSTFLADYYNRLEFIIGVDMCKALHLSDIKTLNFCLPVVFKPCSFDMGTVTIARKDEYRKHFAQDDVYYGLVPVVVYWVIDVPCMMFTAGIGALFCGPIAGVAEYGMANFLAPKLSDSLFDSVCK